MSYVGRFAPSPTGALHFGSLVAAVASYLDAKHNQGLWLVRMEDLDPPREPQGAADQILKTLEQFHLFWDGEVLYQSQRHQAYEYAFNQLQQQNQVFACWCARNKLTAGLHQRPCKEKTKTGASAWRFMCPNSSLTLNDALQGIQTYQLEQQIGDFVLRRRDGLWAYQLAVVVDDEYQGINHIVRGIDLLDSSARQALLIDALGLQQPKYAHIPVAIGIDGHKLSKQAGAQAIITNTPNLVLWQSLKWLQQSPPLELQTATLDEIIQWGIKHWNIKSLANMQSMSAIDTSNAVLM